MLWATRVSAWFGHGWVRGFEVLVRCDGLQHTLKIQGKSGEWGVRGRQEGEIFLAEERVGFSWLCQSRAIH